VVLPFWRHYTGHDQLKKAVEKCEADREDLKRRVARLEAVLELLGPGGKTHAGA
jgi:hypothetical protein